MQNAEDEFTYAQAGVDIEAGNQTVDLIRGEIRSTRRPGADGEIGGFGALFDLKAAGFVDPILVAATDGVGTKVRIAFESGRNRTIGIDLVAMCVNDLVVQGAEPLFFLDYYATGQLDPQGAAAVVAGIAEGCRLAGCALVGGETAEMPGLYEGRSYDLAGFAVGAMERGTGLPRAPIREGDLVFGMRSSGLHSNGFSLVRRVVAAAGLGWDDPAPFDPALSLGEALLMPTRIYVKTLLAALKRSSGIQALAHITGGGFIDNIPRILPQGLGCTIDLSIIDPPKVFGWLARTGRIRTPELARTFNCGIGMVLVVSRASADEVVATFESLGENLLRLGEIIVKSDNRVVLQGDLAV